MKAFLLDPSEDKIWREVDVPTAKEERLLNNSLERLAKEKGLKGLDLPEAEVEYWTRFKTMYDPSTGEDVGFFYKISKQNLDRLSQESKS